MDSKSVNLLIRTEAWPILRKQGFSKFEARTAFRYRAPFVHVVNFQSFNSYFADGQGITTFSFAINVGLYVTGSEGERFVKKDAKGRLMPREYQCGIRSQLRKRTPVDRFRRDDVFHIEGDGSTTEACFREARYLLEEVAPRWFEVLSDVDRLMEWIENGTVEIPGLPAGAPLGFFPGDTAAALRMLKHAESPSIETAEAVVSEIQIAIARVYDHGAGYDSASWLEAKALRIRELWEKLGEFAPRPTESGPEADGCRSLLGAAWGPRTDQPTDGPGEGSTIDASAIRHELWAVLKQAGFKEFTDRLAHRADGDVVDVVAIVPMDPRDRRQYGLPEGSFRVGVGVYWPLLEKGGFCRRNRAGEPRPRITDCHIVDWLMPASPQFDARRSLFSSVEEARRCLAGDGLALFRRLGELDAAVRLLRRPEWENFLQCPLMRGLGAPASTRRMLLLAAVYARFGCFKEARRHVDLAVAAIEPGWPEDTRAQHRDWVEAVRSRLAMKG